MSPIVIRPARVLTHEGRFVAIFDYQGHRFTASIQLPPFASIDTLAALSYLRIAEEMAMRELGRMIAAAANDRLIRFPWRTDASRA